MTWHRPPLLRNVGFLKGIVHAPRTPEQREADERRQAASASASGAPSARGAVPGADAGAPRPRSGQLPKPTVAQTTSELATPTPGLQSFLARADLPQLRQSGLAIDLGSGGGRDTRALADAGWHVHAIDPDPAAATALKATTDRGAATMHVGSLDAASLPPPGSVDVVNAQRALPFLGDQLPATLDRLRDLVRPGGVAVMSFFGDQHSWATRPRITAHDATAVRAMLESRGLDVVHFEDIKRPNHRAANGTVVPMWHEIRVQAQRPPEAPAAPQGAGQAS